MGNTHHSFDERLVVAGPGSNPGLTDIFLTELQSKHLWQKIIREDPTTPDLNLLHVKGAAAHAFKAYQLIQEYRLPRDKASFENYTEETLTFHRWMSHYENQLKEWKALDPSELLDAVCESMKQKHAPLPEEISFLGFDRITPQFQEWLNFLKCQHVPIQFKPFEPSPVGSNQLNEIISQRQAGVQKYESAIDEVTQCARWIRKIYKEGNTIGIVVPKLEEYRGILEREFKGGN